MDDSDFSNDKENVILNSTNVFGRGAHGATIEEFGPGAHGGTIEEGMDIDTAAHGSVQPPRGSLTEGTACSGPSLHGVSPQNTPLAEVKAQDGREEKHDPREMEAAFGLLSLQPVNNSASTVLSGPTQLQKPAESRPTTTCQTSDLPDLIGTKREC